MTDNEQKKAAQAFAAERAGKGGMIVRDPSQPTRDVFDLSGSNRMFTIE